MIWIAICCQGGVTRTNEHVILHKSVSKNILSRLDNGISLQSSRSRCSITKPHESKFRAGQLRVDLVIRMLESRASTSAKASAHTATCVLRGRLFLDISSWQGRAHEETICFCRLVSSRAETFTHHMAVVLGMMHCLEPCSRIRW